MKWKLFIGQSLIQQLLDAEDGGGSGGDSGVDNTPAAGEGTGSDGLAGDGTSSGEPNESGVDGGSDAGSQDPDNPTPDPEVEKAFAKRLAAAEEKIKAKVAAETRQTLLGELNPLLEVAQFEAARHGLTPIEWARRVSQNRQASYEQQLAATAEEYGIDPQTLIGLVNNHPLVVEGQQVKQTLQQQGQQNSAKAKFEAEGLELFGEYPDLEIDDIPDEVYALRAQRGIPLLDAYRRVMAPKEKQAKLVADNNQNNKGKSPGGLAGKPAPANGYYSFEQVQKMSQAEVIKNYDAIMASQKKWKK